MSKQEGITVKQVENWGDWYSQVVLKSELADYTQISGCYVLRPKAYFVWEKIQEFFDKEIKKLGVRNAYFPLFIPENLLNKESEHVEGFTPEVAWITHSGKTKLKERLAIRPTSETIMYDSYSRWIRSHRDLPLRLNQWNNIVRWEFKNPILLIRFREFLWQEGHTVFANKKNAEKEVLDILNLYASVYEELLAVPVISGRKTEKEKFAGAVYTTSVETFLPNGRGVQAGTSHFLGQKFAKAFGIKYLDKAGKENVPYQNSWGLSARAIGTMVFMHSDDKGLVLPPRVADIQVVIVPIFTGKDKEKVLRKARELKSKLRGLRVLLDSRDEYRPGWKFNEWELKGVPLRIEIGPKDLAKRQVVIVKRNDGKKTPVKLTKVREEVVKTLGIIQTELFKAAERKINRLMVRVSSLTELKKALAAKKVGVAGWCGSTECEDAIKDKTGGKTSVIPFNDKKVSTDCISCRKRAEHMMRFAKYY